MRGLPATALFCCGPTMLDVNGSLPEDLDESKKFTAPLLAEVTSQAVPIKKLRHPLAGHRNHRSGSSPETIKPLQLALEASGIALARMTAKRRLPDGNPKDKPKPRPIPAHIPRLAVALTTGDGVRPVGDDDCARCGGAPRRPGGDVTGKLEYMPGRFMVNRIVGHTWRAGLRGIYASKVTLYPRHPRYPRCPRCPLPPAPDRTRPSRPKPAAACAGQ